MSKEFEKLDWTQLSSRQRMSPFPNYLSMESICNEMKENVGFAFEQMLMIFKNNVFFIYFDAKDEDRMNELAYDWVKRDPIGFRKIINKINEIAGPFLDKLENLTDKEVEKLSNDKLASLFKYYETHYKAIYSRYFTILACEGKFTEELKQVIGQYESNPEKASHYFTTLTTEPEAMVNQREAIGRIDVIEPILANATWKELINQSTEAILAEKELSKLIFDHLDKYYWITRDYEDSVISFEEMVARVRSSIIDLDQLKAKKVEVDYHPAAISELEANLKLTNEEKALFKAIRDGLELKERRKEIVSKSLYHFDKVLLEVCRRADLSMPQVRFAKTGEIGEILQAETGSWREKLTERYNLSVWMVETSIDTKIETGAKAEKWYKRLVEINPAEINELKGQPLSRGKVTGPVKIMLHPEESDKIEPGDILVTIQAVPAFSSAISRAAAMLADGGTGLTSHTATLAREAKIPAVGQLKIACRVLKDGDIVEVDGDTGIVKLIK